MRGVRVRDAIGLPRKVTGDRCAKVSLVSWGVECPRIRRNVKMSLPPLTKWLAQTGPFFAVHLAAGTRVWRGFVE